MIGFIKGIFGSNKTSKQASQPPVAGPRNSQNLQAFFLDMDDARTLGNVEYMRTAKSIKRTFPKTRDSLEEKAIMVEISSLLKRDASLGKGLLDSVNGSQSTTSKVDDVAERRRSDTSMDIFRNMARDIKKR